MKRVLGKRDLKRIRAKGEELRDKSRGRGVFVSDNYRGRRTAVVVAIQMPGPVPNDPWFDRLTMSGSVYRAS
jgi:hypothetical protein